MRRKDREITDFNDKLAIIEKYEVLRLAMMDAGSPYIVPLNFGYEVTGESVTIYVHGAQEGKKIDLLRKNPNVCFEMDGAHELVENENACAVTYKYESVIGLGKAVILEDTEEKTHALRVMLKCITGRDYAEIDTKAVEKTAVIKIEVTELTAKRH